MKLTSDQKLHCIKVVFNTIQSNTELLSTNHIGTTLAYLIGAILHDSKITLELSIQHHKIFFDLCKDVFDSDAFVWNYISVQHESVDPFVAA